MAAIRTYCYPQAQKMEFFFKPVLATAGIMLVLPPIAMMVFARSESTLERWLEVGFDADTELLELINSGVSIEVVRRRLGHASTETTQVYTLLADKIADAEIRAARRKRETGRR